MAGENLVLLYQGIMEPQIKAMQKDGGNSLSISPSNGPLYLIYVPCCWNNEAIIYNFITKVLKRIKAEATTIGKHNNYIYINYANLHEDVIRSYGPDNKAKPSSIA